MEVFQDGDKENCNTISIFEKAGSRNEPVQKPRSQGTSLTRVEACVYGERDWGENHRARVQDSPLTEPLFSRVSAIVFQS